MTARRVLAAAALAGLGASGAAADDGRNLLDDCLSGVVAGLKAIGTEFPEFRAAEVRMNLGMIEGLREGTRERTAAADWSEEDVDEVMALVGMACSSSDDVADILRELRDGSWMVAGLLWRQWRWDGSPP